jgi:thioesterase domain-containing protein
MADISSPIIFLSGAGGGAPDLNVFREGAEDPTRFEVIGYPGWKSYVAVGFSAETLIADLAARIAERIPRGPIRIVGLSIGGHLGYGAGLRLQAMGREIAGFCAIDSFMPVSTAPSAGWTGRAAAEGLGLLFRRRFGEFVPFLRSKFWRALIRLGGGRLPRLLQQSSAAKWLPSFLAVDPMLEQELSMRLLIREVTPWIASLDCEPVVALKAPAVLLRTKSSSGNDPAWRRRCPKLKIVEIGGQHHSLFDPENIEQLRQAFLAATRDWVGSQQEWSG